MPDSPVPSAEKPQPFTLFFWHPHQRATVLRALMKTQDEANATQAEAAHILIQFARHILDQHPNALTDAIRKSREH